jgi:hypothetical protein
VNAAANPFCNIHLDGLNTPAVQGMQSKEVLLFQARLLPGEVSAILIS